MLLTQAIDFLPDPTFAIDLTGKVLMWNRAMESLTRIRAEDMVGRGDFEYALPFYGERRPVLIDMVLQDIDGLKDRYSTIRHEGDTLYAETAGLCPEKSLWGKASPIYDDDGGIIGAIESIRDITDRKQSEEALRQREERYRDILNDMEEAYYEVDLEGRFTFFNHAIARTYGYARDELMNTSYKVTLDRENMEKVSAAFHQVYVSGETIKGIDWKLRNKNGKEVYIEASVSLRRDPQGKPTGFKGIARDITERKQAERILRENQERLHGITANIPGVVFQFYAKDNGEYGISYASKNIIDLFGPDEGVESMYTTFLSRIHEEDRARFRSSIQEAVAAYSRWSFEGRFVQPSGRVIWFQGHSIPTRTGDRIVFDGLLLDITERKLAEEKSRQSEENFYKVFMMAPDGISISRMADGLIIDVNIGFMDILGWKPDEFIGRTSQELNFWADPAERALMVEDLKHGRDIRQREFLFRRSDGSVRTGIYSARSIQMEGEAFILFILRDITDQRRLEEDSQKLEQQLAQSQKMESIGTLAGGIAHDFNNILAAIIGYTELAMDDMSSPEKARGELGEVLRAGDRARDLVKQILTFSRRASITRSPLELSPFIKESLKMLRSVIPSTIEIRQDLVLTGLVMSNPSQVNQIIMNLCTNAVHAMDTTGGVLDVGLKKVELDQTGARDLDVSAGPYLRLTVRDSGHGMAPGVLERIYEPYFTTKDLGRGTGLGLSVVHGIVKSHGGAIVCMSIPDRGTTFDVYLPEVESGRKEPGPPPREQFPLGTERILFIDDEEVLAELAGNMLGKLGYQVTARTSSVEAFDFFRSRPDQFDLVITDMTMPGMTGDHVARKIMEIRPDMPVILCSGYSEHISEEKAREIGIRKFVLKPFEMKELAKTIRTVLDGG